MWLQNHVLVHVLVAMLFQALPLTATPINATSDTMWPTPTESYFRNASSSWLYAHIFFMSLSWIGALPICVLTSAPTIYHRTEHCIDMVLNIARSTFRYPSHIIFLCLHAIGTVIGMIYNSRTPDFYP